MAYCPINEDHHQLLEKTESCSPELTKWNSVAKRPMGTPGKLQWNSESSYSITYHDCPIQDLFTRARSKSDTSSFAQVKLLRVRVAGSVDGLDKASIANCDAPNSGNQSPPLKRKGRLSSIGKIFKPWKWRKKKASEKFRETSAVLERKISMRQSREELIRRGVLKEIPDQDGEVPINMGTSNGHTVPISEEPPKEQKPSAGNGAIASKISVSEEKTEDKKESTEKTVGVPETKTKKAVTTSKISAASAGPSHRKDEPSSKKPAKSISKQLSAPALKTTSRAGTQENNASSSNRKTAATKTSSSTLASTSSRPKASKEQLSSKTGISTTPRAKKLPSKSLSVDQPLLSNASSTGLKKRDRTELAAQKVDSDIQENNATENTPTEQQKPQSTSPAVKHQLKNQCNVSDTSQEEKPRNDSATVCEILQLPENSNDSKTTLEIAHVNEENTESDVPLISHEDTSSLKSHEVTDEPSETSVIPDGDSEGKESQASDSDSDGPILYTDDDDDDDDSTESTLASKIRRRDTLAIKLGNRPSKKDLEDKNILPRNSEEERQEMWQQIGTKLVRRLSQRPTSEELEQRNILKQKNEEEEQEARRELKRRLTRKLSLRPSVAELQARRILRFNEYVEVTDSLDYDRRADKPWARLTPADKAAIRKELNEFKSTEMEVHEESRQFTRFHRP
ncbi:phosphatase and actin regulator 2 isoform X2 [Pyxicephalus adspersus]|uniref:phosphatase and actin regulator 2 isoform X2 n=1 Tax=Pyxicephalus adspersus TaxID=30357 RepID=UPI003B5973B4